MSKRLCTSLLHAPRRSHQSLPLPRCGIHPTTFIVHDDISQRQPPSKRHFTCSPPAGRRQMSPSIAVEVKQKQKSAERDGAVLEHLGLIPNTFVPPTGKNLPSWFSNPRDRWKVSKLVVRNWYLYLTGRVLAFWFIKPRLDLERGKLPTISKKLYEDMYTHFATGNLQAVEPILSSGILGSLRARIALRAPNSGLKWTLHKYLSTPRVVSYTFQTLPGGQKTDQVAIAQAVVQIKSLQSLTRTQRLRVVDRGTNRASIQESTLDEQGRIVPQSDLEDYKRRVAKATTEYLVVQRFVRHSRPEQWHIWGTAEETKVIDVRRKEKMEEEELVSRI